MEVLAPVAEAMDRVDVWWAVAGGWAIDLWLGEQTRDHHDVEVVTRRSDQTLVHAALSTDWELFVLDPPGEPWRPWGGRPIEAPAFQLQARSSRATFDIFTETVDESRWCYRRDRRIVTDSASVVVSSASGLPIVRPEIQLLYMATSTDAKNQHDFEMAVPRLSPDAVRWLATALQATRPGHRWLDQLG